MSFLKLRCERAYSTGAIRTNLTLKHLASKLTTGGLPSRVEDGMLVVRCGSDEWCFADWVEEGMGRVGWLQFTMEGDLGTLSRQLARVGIRHRLEYSRPFDLETDDVRSVTSHEHNWGDGIGVRVATLPKIDTYDETL